MYFDRTTKENGSTMGTITVVNLTNSSLQSAITNTGVIYSGVNGIPANSYYHHNALRALTEIT
jgi:hypothetical protein